MVVPFIKFAKVLGFAVGLLMLSQEMVFAQPCSPGTKGGRGGLNANLSEFSNKSLTQKTVQLNEQSFIVEIAQTPAENIRGLAGRKSLAANSGMVFLFPNSKATNQMDTAKTEMPVDMIFINPSNQIACIYKDAKPLSKERYECKGSMAAIMINAGEADKYKLKEGMTVEGI